MVLFILYTCISWHHGTSLGARGNHVRGNLLRSSFRRQVTLGNERTPVFFWERNGLPHWQHVHQPIRNSIQPRRLFSTIVSRMWRRERENEEVFGTKEYSLSLLAQQAWVSVKSDMSDKAVTACESASWDTPDEFFRCYYFSLSYERTNMFSRPDCEAVSTLCGRVQAPGLRLGTPTHQGLPGALCNWVSAFGMPLTLGMGWNREGRALSISPWDDHCFPRNHSGGRGGWREAFSLTAPCLVHSSSETSSKFWGLTLPLLPLLSHSHSSLTSLEKIDHVCLWFSSDPPSALWG